jgi:YesN/AraC family two-component response regulator
MVIMSEKNIVRILLIDDDPDFLALLETLIKQKFPEIVQIRSTSDAGAALRILETELVDVLITDLQMPKIDGMQLISNAKRNNVWTQILLVTGHSTLELLMEVVQHGTIDFLQKPIDKIEFEEVIDSIINRIFRYRRALANLITSG